MTTVAMPHAMPSMVSAVRRRWWRMALKDSLRRSCTIEFESIKFESIQRKQLTRLLRSLQFRIRWRRGKPRLYSGFGRVAAKETVGFPMWRLRIVGDINQQSADDLFIFCGGRQIHWLIHVVGWSMVALGQPVLEDFCLGRAGFGAEVHGD